MTERQRPDPDVLLRQVKAEEKRHSRARLMVFFGYAPGVGKTYSMLESARRLKGQGVDVVVGCVETHGRPETAALMEGLEILPRRSVSYRGTRLAEFDLDFALGRKPQVLLLDELAHTNAPGSRHPKRWQDALELLDAGIEVHTTLNVQHVESLNDVIAQITLVRVRETVPDSILERADEIELVDLTPDELLVRLREGKVYIPEQARHAADHFFKRGNLLALRELALRRTADRVDVDVRAYRQEYDIKTTWPAAERIVVCVGPSPSSAAIIRGARRMAASLQAPWVAAYVEAPDEFPMTEVDRERLQAHLRLAELLGAEVVRLSGSRVSDELLRYAREHNATRIVIGKPTHSRWRDLLKGSLVAELVRGSGEIEVHFMAADEEPARTPRPMTQRQPVDWTGYLLAAASVTATTVLSVAARRFLALPDVVTLYILVIMVVAYRLGRGPSLFAAGVSVASYDFFFIPPHFTFTVEEARHLFTFAMMFVVGMVISGLTGKLRRQEREARAREARTGALFRLSGELVAVSDAQRAAEITAQRVAEVFGGEVAVLLEEPGRGLVQRGMSNESFVVSEHERAVAQWAADHGRPAGQGTDTLPGARVMCTPLQSGPRTLGVLVLRVPSPTMLEMEQRAFLDGFVRQATLAVARAQLAEEAKTSTLRAKTEEMRSSLLSAVSHDLRTPLAAITGAGTTLRDNHDRLTPEQRAELVDAICAEAERMERLVGNLLDMVRLDSGSVVPRREWVLIEEVIGSALQRMDAKLVGREVKLDLSDGLPLVFLDPVLFEQVLVNLIENAVKYTPQESPIEVKAHVEQGVLEIEAADRGPGFPAGEESRLFEKFHRGLHTGIRGVGLGLPICRGIVQSHGGSIVAENRMGGGAVFTIRLPLLQSPPKVMPIGEDTPSRQETPS